MAELAKAHQLTAQVLEEGTRTWQKLVNRSCPFYEHYKELPVEDYTNAQWEVSYRDCTQDRLSRQQVNISHLTSILREMENPRLPLLELLHTICERFPPVIFRLEENGRPMAFHLSCPCKRSHAVTHLGFLLLEEVEGGLESAEQQVEKVFLGWLWGSWFSALESRARRQQRSVNKVEADEFVFEEEDYMEKLLSLQQNCQKLTFGEAVVVPGLDGKGGVAGYGQDFWAQMARSLKLGNLVIDTVGTTRNYLLQGRREDLRAIWDAQVPDAGGCSFFIVYNGPFPVLWWTSEEEKEKAWMDFQLILDTKPQQWPERLKQQLELSEEEDSSDGSEAS